MQYLIQEKANLAILEGTKDLIVFNIREGDQEGKSRILLQAYDKINKSMLDLIEERDRRYAAINGQAALFSSIKIWLLILGSLMVIIGKYISYGILKRNIDNRHNI
jgi:hypothetical protein